MQEEQIKRKLVYFMAPADSYSPVMRHFFVNNVLRGLSEFFELVVISQDCDYAEICDRHQPDIAMFDGAVEPLPCRLPIRNTSAFPTIPKVGFCKVDPYSQARSVFLSEMESLGIETIFAWDPAMAEYTPELAGELFYWPAFVDTRLFRDYGENKLIPLLFLGRCDGPSLQHSWRVKAKTVTSKRYPSLVVPDPFTNDVAFTVHGEQYARLINASMVVPTAGSMTKTLVMKHLEIPAAKACLVTERTPIVEAFGFLDMENCVFADEHDIIDKLDYLFSNRDVLESVTNNGYEFVRSRHTAKQRPQIFQWLQLYKSLRPGQRIVQTRLFNELEIVNEASPVRNCYIISGCEDRILLEDGDQKLQQGKYREAELLYLRCLDYVSWMPDPQLRFALCKLYQGKAAIALHWVGYLLKQSLGEYEARDPDPVEWAYFLITLLCNGHLEHAATFAKYFPDLHHPELARARWTVCILTNKLHEAQRIRTEMQHRLATRRSVHRLPEMSFEEYVRRVRTMLKRCKQRRLARILSGAMESRQSTDGRNIHGKGNGSPTCVANNDFKMRADISHLLRILERIDRKDRIRIVVSKRIGPTLAQRINALVRQKPLLKAKVKAFLMDHLKVQDW